MIEEQKESPPAGALTGLKKVNLRELTMKNISQTAQIHKEIVRM
jgi:hypothetical protein